MKRQLTQSHTALCLLHAAQDMLLRAERESGDPTLQRFVSRTNKAIDKQIQRQLHRYDSALEKTP